MLRSDVGMRGVVGRRWPTQIRPCSGLRVGRPARQPHLGVSAFKDWFSGLVQQKDAPGQPQQTSQHGPHDQSPQSQHQPAPLAPMVAPKRDFLEARQVSLYQLFDSSDYKFDIPSYQRPYAWRTKQIYELLQDFVKAYQSRQEYFLGAIVATRAADGAHVPYQLIDGQQRLTSLVVLLACLHGWAREQGNEVLEGRIRRMLHLEADPLDPESRERYRLRLRDNDDAFFRANVLDAFLPQPYRLAGVAAGSDSAAAAEGAAGPGAVPCGAAAGWAPDTQAAQPLENETWWRLYENAAFLRCQLDKLVSEGLNLQDFTFHVLRNCFVVLMVARDESASFRIFSTLNGRGMDLSVVDKLKADLLAADLSPAERSHFSDAWAEMESVLGRTAFHRVFDYMRELAAVRDPWVMETSVLEYFTRKVDDPRAVKQILQVSLDYARLLLQLRQAIWASPELAALLAESPQQQDEEEALDPAAQMEREAAVVAAVQVVLEQEQVLAPDEEGLLLERLHEQHRQWQDGSVGLEQGLLDSGLLAAEELEVPAATAASVVEAVAAMGVLGAEADGGSSRVVIKEAADEKEGALVFRFDDVAAAVGGPQEQAAVTLAAADDVIASEEAALLAAAEQVPSSASLSADLPAMFAITAANGSSDSSLLAVASEDARQRHHLEKEATAPQELAVVSERQELAVVSESQELAADTTIAAAATATAVSEEQQQRERAVRQQAALLEELDARSRHLNMFADEAWLPPLLEFFYQTDSLKHRVAFMQAAESLQLLLELHGDPAAKAARWGAVANALLQRPFSPEGVLAAVRLNDQERDAFRARLDSKDLYATVDQRTLRHLLVRCEPPSVAAQLTDIAGLIVEKVAPQSAPEGSLWRKTRITSSCDPRSPWPETWFITESQQQQVAADSAVGGADNRHTTEVSEPSLSGSTVPPSSSYEVKYWYEVQRLNWHGKLGNLVLLPATASSAASATADYDAKAALWRQGGVAARLPGFTGPMVDEHGRYGRFRFCYDECRQRHADMLEHLAAVFEL